MTGRIVDSYTNIQTVKLFAAAPATRTPTSREAIDDTPRHSGADAPHHLHGDAVDRSTRCWSSAPAAIALTPAGTRAMSAGRSPPRCRSAWYDRQRRRLDHLAGYASSRTSAWCRRAWRRSPSPPLVDAPGARELAVSRGEIVFDRVTSTMAAATRRRCSPTDLSSAPARRSAWSAAPAPASRRWSTCCCASSTSRAARIRIDGQDIRTRHPGEPARRRSAWSRRTPRCCTARSRDNIRYGRPDATSEIIEAAAQKAQAHDFILGLATRGPHRLRRPRRRARRQALRRPAPAHRDRPRDPEGRADPRPRRGDLGARQRGRGGDPGAALGLMEGKTVIAIAHRLSTIARMDRLVVLDDGRIVEEGTPRRAAARGGLYAALWRRQSGGFLTEDVRCRHRAGTGHADAALLEDAPSREPRTRRSPSPARTTVAAPKPSRTCGPGAMRLAGAVSRRMAMPARTRRARVRCRRGRAGRPCRRCSSLPAAGPSRGCARRRCRGRSTGAGCRPAPPA